MTVSVDLKTIALDLVDRGWSALPLPERAKWPPPDGFTGYRGRMARRADVEAWGWTGNIALRLPPDVVGVDVDVYRGGSLQAFEGNWGELPPTVWSTSRDDGSGIALFRVPVGTTLRANPTEGIEIVQHHHRYAVISPSVHPDTGEQYQLIDEASGETLDQVPDIDDLPEMPWAWIEGLRAIKGQTAAAASGDEITAFVTETTERRVAGKLKGIETRLANFIGSRHDTLVEVACWAMREAAAGAYTAADAIELLEGWWHRVMDDPERREGGEFGAAIRWAVAQVALEPGRVAEIRDSLSRPAEPPPNVDPATGEILRPTLNLPDEFWSARPELDFIRRAAHSRVRSADSVLLATLARLAAVVHPTTVLPPIAGGIASLNFLGGVVSASGGGKTTSVDVARELLPIERKDVIADVPPGSGEGLAEMYFELVEEDGDDGKKRKVKSQTKSGAFIYLDEGQALAEMGSRKGATLLPTLRSAWSGAVVGQSNATAETHRVLKAHTYRMSIVVGFQYEYAADLIADAPGGTPQRFVFASATDPSVPDERPDWPGLIEFDVPPVIRPHRELDFARSVVEEIQARQLAQARGEFTPDALDTHADLVRMKVAALLALLGRRFAVDVEDWELAGALMTTSRAVRSAVIEHARSKAAATERARTALAVDREATLADAAERRALMSGAKSLARRAHKVGGRLAKRDLQAAVASKHKAAASVDEMIAYAESKDWIEPVEDGWEAADARPV